MLASSTCRHTADGPAVFVERAIRKLLLTAAGDQFLDYYLSALHLGRRFFEQRSKLSPIVCLPRLLFGRVHKVLFDSWLDCKRRFSVDRFQLTYIAWIPGSWRRDT